MPTAGSNTFDSALLLSIGQKAIGLLRIPELWRPPFFVLPTDVYFSWQNASADSRNSLLESSSTAIAEGAARFGAEWSGGLILRSSAVTESLNDRGAYDSRPLSADFDHLSIKDALSEIYTRFNRVSPENHLAIVIQPLVPGPRRYIGHASNERRVSKTINQWMLECPDFEQIERFNSQRSEIANPSERLVATNAKSLLAAFKSIGRWCTRFGNGPCHIEWAWSNERIWLLQLDFEDESPDDGIDPRQLIRAADVSVCSARNIPPLIHVDIDGAPTGWGKIDKTRELASVRPSRFPDLYYLPATRIVDAELTDAIESISNGRAVCRTDCKSSKIEKLNLPRTHSVSPSGATKFMRETAEDLRRRGAVNSEICFILHRFIPATASAWSLADPNSQIVRVDSLWGIPDGLQFLPHDTFEYDVKRREISSQTIRYKVSCIQETENGLWEEKKIARRYGRSMSLSSGDVREIASQSFEIAKRLGQKTQVMWFCGIPGAVGIGKNLPWFRMTPEEDNSKNPSRPAGPVRNKFRIRDQNDLARASKLDVNRCVLSVQPNVDLIRKDDSFLNTLVTVANEIGAPVELDGSILGHAYYMLRRAGITVIATGERHYSRVRGKQVFAKLVRDDIPQQIERHGETTVLAKISKHESRPALIVKLFEEANELLRARNPTEVEAELADLLEVVRSLALATGVNWEDVQTTSDKKRAQRGGFDRGVVLMQTAWPKSGIQIENPPAEIPLKSLGQVREFEHGADLNFASLLAKGGNSIFTTHQGGSFKVSLTATGLRIERVGPEALVEQLMLPGFEN